MSTGTLLLAAFAKTFVLFGVSRNSMAKAIY